MKQPRWIVVNFIYRSRTSKLAQGSMECVYNPHISMRRNYDKALKTCSLSFDIHHFESLEFKI